MVVDDVYGVYDAKAQKFVSVFLSDNDETAKRAYLNSLQQVPPLTARDLRLYKIKSEFSYDSYLLPDRKQEAADKEVDNG